MTDKNVTDDFHNSYRYRTGRTIKEDGEVINFGDLLDTVVHDGTLISRITVNPQGVEVKAGATPLVGRHTVYIINDSSALIFIGFDTIPVVGSITPIVLFSGESIGIRLEAHTEKRIFAITREYVVPIRIIEVK